MAVSYFSRKAVGVMMQAFRLVTQNVDIRWTLEKLTKLQVQTQRFLWSPRALEHGKALLMSLPREKGEHQV